MVLAAEEIHGDPVQPICPQNLALKIYLAVLLEVVALEGTESTPPIVGMRTAPFGRQSGQGILGGRW